jgi:hypothetical protein
VIDEEFEWGPNSLNEALPRAARRRGRIALAYIHGMAQAAGEFAQLLKGQLALPPGERQVRWARAARGNEGRGV